MASSNRPPSRPASRTPSIPIPGAAPRTIEDILNINTLGSPPGTLSRAHESRPEQRQSRTASRSLYSGIEASRPTAGVRHASTSSSVGSSRPSLLGGNGPPWASRAVSTSSAPVLPGTFGMQSAFSGFQPRVIGGSGATPTERNGASAEQDSPAIISLTRGVGRIHTQSRPPQIARDIPIRSHSQRTAPVVSSISSPYTQHLGSGAPIAFPRPSYLRFSFLRDLLQTDVDTAFPLQRPAPPLVTGRDITPFTESDDDSESSTGFSRRPYAHRERGRTRERKSAYQASLPQANVDPVIYLPTRWNEQDRNKYLHVSEDGRNLSFHGPNTQGEKEAAAARANHTIPPACGIYYYEVQILDKGYKGHISVGFSCHGVKLNRLPGWEKNSWGYHGDDGHSFASERDGTPFGPRFTTGDVIGCGIDFCSHRAFYTKNGSLIGYAFDNIGLDDSVIFPSVGLRTPQEHIRVNFGQEPFKFNIDDHVRCERDRAWERIQSTPVKWTIDETRDIFELEIDKTEKKDTSADVKQEAVDDEFPPIQLPRDYSEPIDKLVLSYLQHHGYENTAVALRTQIDARRKKVAATSKLMAPKREEMDVDIKMEADDSLPSNTSDGTSYLTSLVQEFGFSADAMRSRQRVVTAVLAGDIDLALQLTRELFPSVSDADDGFLLLKLKCRKFVELVLLASDALQAMTQAESAAISNGSETPASIGEGAMDVDEESAQSPTNGVATNNVPPSTGSPPPVLSQRMKRSSSRTIPPPAVAAYETALADLLAYGKALQAEMPGPDSPSKLGARPEAHALLKETFGLVSFEDPRAVVELQALLSQEARVKLASEVNQAILVSQGRPSRPALERLYRQTNVALTQLALIGVGDAAFADMRGEFLDE
ncbi:hypothetical protein ACEPAI_1200 [Sanghuangporus weigelae]